jgi:MFS family permease
MQSLDATILNTALPAMATELGESPMKMQSVIVAYALTTAMLIPATGWVADRFGTRRVYGWAIGLFVLGSVLCALSPSLPFLIAARVVQGVGGAMMLPVGRLAVLRTYPRGEFIRAMSFIAIPARSAAAGAYPGRLDGGVRQLALDLLDQCARGPDRAVGHLALVPAQRARGRAPL